MCTKNAANLLVDTRFTHSLVDTSEPEPGSVKLLHVLSSLGSNGNGLSPGHKILSVDEAFRAFHNYNHQRCWNIPRSVHPSGVGVGQ